MAEAEMHVKMCKKIAQLTKVILNLNTKYEEHDSIVEELNAEHERNVERIMNETKKEIFALREECDRIKNSERDAKKASQEIEHENKRLNTLVKDQQESYAQSVECLTNEQIAKYLALENKYKEEKRESERLACIVEQLRTDLACKEEGVTNALKARHEEEITALKKKHDEQMKSNSAQNEVKIQELCMKIDKLEREKINCKIEFDKKLEEQNNDYKHELKRYQGQESDNLNCFESNNKLLSDKVFELENTLQENTASFDKIENCKNDLEIKLAEKEMTVLHQRAEIENLCAEKTSNFEFILSLENKLKESQFENDNLKKKVENNEKSIIDLENDSSQLQTLQEEIIRLTELLKSVEKKLYEAEEELNERNKELKSVKFAKAKLHENSAADHKEFKEEKMFFRREIEVTQKEVKKKCDEVDDLREKITQITRAHDNKVHQLEKKHTEQILTERNTHSKNLDVFKRESGKILHECQKKLCDEFAETQQKMIEKHDEKIAEKERTIEKLSAELNLCRDEIDTLSSQLIEYKQVLQTAELGRNDQVDLMKQLNVKLTHFEKTNQALQKELAKIKENLEFQKKQWEAKLKEQRKSMEEKILKEKKLLEAKHTQQTSSGNAGWQSKVDELKKSFLEKEETFKINHNIQLQLKEHQIANDNLKQKALLREKLKTDEELVTCKRTHEELLKCLSKRMDDERRQFNENLTALNTQHSRELNESKELWGREKQSALESLQQTHQAETFEVRNENNISIGALKSSHQIHLKEQLQLARDQFDQEKRTLQEAIQQQHKEKMHRVLEERAEEIRAINRQLREAQQLRNKEFEVHTKKIRELVTRLEEEEERGEGLVTRVALLESDCVKLRRELETKGEEILEVRRECNSRMRVQLDEMEATYKQNIEGVQGKCEMKIKATVGEAKSEQSKLNESISFLKVMLDESEERYRLRPSRDEDVELINSLHNKLSSSCVETQRLKEAKQQYRLELLNREENFNKVFNSTPLVGTIDPLNIKKRSTKSAKTFK